MMTQSDISTLADKLLQLLLARAAGASNITTAQVRSAFDISKPATNIEDRNRSAGSPDKVAERATSDILSKLPRLVAETVKLVSSQQSRSISDSGLPTGKILATQNSEASKKDGESIGEKIGEGTKKVFDGLAGKLLAILGPAALLATALGSQASGVSVFMGAIKVVGNVLGSTLYPIIALGAAVVLSLSDVIRDALLPNLEAWYSAVINNGLSAIEQIEKALINGANGVIDFTNSVLQSSAQMDKATAFFMLMTSEVMKLMGKKNEAAVMEVAAGLMIKRAVETEGNQVAKIDATKNFYERLNIKTDANGRPVLGDGPAFTDRVKTNLGKVNEQFRLENMPKASQMGLADAAVAAQMSALAMTPFQQKELELLSRVADAMDQAVAKLRPPTNE